MRVVGGLCACLLILWTGPAHAIPVTWRLTGTTGSVAPEAAGPLGSLGVTAGTPFTADFTLESSTPPVPSPDYLAATFPGAMLAFSFVAAGYSVHYTAGPESGITASAQDL